MGHLVWNMRWETKLRSCLSFSVTVSAFFPFSEYYLWLIWAAEKDFRDFEELHARRALFLKNILILSHSNPMYKQNSVPKYNAGYFMFFIQFYFSYTVNWHKVAATRAQRSASIIFPIMQSPKTQ